jgi:molybdenum cofactor cytidylyltransferase
VSEQPIGIILLAAGASLRMGKPKQLLLYEGETLLKRAVRSASESKADPVIIVLGSEADVSRDEIAEMDVRVVVNQGWQEGMSSSIRCGLDALEAAGQAQAVVLMLCDQPFVSVKVINRLIEAYQTEHPTLVASEYESEGEKTLGVPALFSHALFSELMSLRGAEGAKRIIERHRSETVIISVPEAAFDVDTPDDYRILLKEY